jgi:hypothetical protein
MLLPTGLANTKCSVCRFDRSGSYGEHEAQLERVTLDATVTHSRNDEF